MSKSILIHVHDIESNYPTVFENKPKRGIILPPSPPPHPVHQNIHACIAAIHKFKGEVNEIYDHGANEGLNNKKTHG